MEKARQGQTIYRKAQAVPYCGGGDGYDLHLRQFLAIADNTKRSNGLDSLYDISYLSFKFGMLQGLRYSAKHSGEEIRETLDKAERGELHIIGADAG